MIFKKSTEEALNSFEPIYSAGGKRIWETLYQSSESVLHNVANRIESFAKSANRNSEWIKTLKSAVFAKMEKMGDSVFSRWALLSDQRLRREFDAIFISDSPDFEYVWNLAKTEVLPYLFNGKNAFFHQSTKIYKF